MPDHWYRKPELCLECGEFPESERHFHKCSSGKFWTSHRPGFGFCQLVYGHEGNHQVEWWNGEVTEEPNE